MKRSTIAIGVALVVSNGWWFLQVLDAGLVKVAPAWRPLQ